MTGLLSDPEWGEVAQKLFYFLKKIINFFYIQTLQASLGFVNKKNLPASLKSFWSESVPVFRTYLMILIILLVFQLKGQYPTKSFVGDIDLSSNQILDFLEFFIE
jgi:hypothetical protein